MLKGAIRLEPTDEEYRFLWGQRGWLNQRGKLAEDGEDDLDTEMRQEGNRRAQSRRFGIKRGERGARGGAIERFG